MVWTSPQKWQSPKNFKNPIKTVKITISKNWLRYNLPTTQTNLYTKFHEIPLRSLAYIAILVRTENREQRTESGERRAENGELTQKSVLLFLSPRGLKRTDKKFQRDRKKRNHWPYSIIGPWGLRTYKKLRLQRSE